MMDKYKPLIALVLWMVFVGIQAGWAHEGWATGVSIAITAVLTALHYTPPTVTAPPSPVEPKESSGA